MLIDDKNQTFSRYPTSPVTTADCWVCFWVLCRNIKLFNCSWEKKVWKLKSKSGHYGELSAFNIFLSCMKYPDIKLLSAWDSKCQKSKQSFTGRLPLAASADSVGLSCHLVIVFIDGTIVKVLQVLNYRFCTNFNYAMPINR